MLRAKENPKMHAPRPLGELQVGEFVVGFWLFTHRRRVHLGVFDLDRREFRSTLTFARLEADGQATPVRRIENEDASIRAVDARVVGPDMRFVLELNRGVPLQLTRTALEPLLEPAGPPLTFSPARPLGPWPQLDARIQLDIGEQWNVADSLRPEQWLFNPRFSPGAPTASMSVNTADGQTLLLTDEGAPAGLLSDAALPQWWDRPALRVVAFQRMARAYRPFLALSRYSAPKLIPPSELWVVDASTAPRSLSAECKLGAVIGFALAEGPRGEPWLLALTRARAGVVISALARAAKGWAMVHEWPVDALATRIVALWHDDAWHIVLGHGEPATSLHYLRR
ncbi:hypothetical protein [Pyxidicoccus trucidator]|uniref:hypothetical protein n=1 Tax=Pyxidicoccus trucidator TaxID=2709662 RepID=UPI001968265F|nr:hypothetical protein [Pyxidicoccus trucidator]